jgi:hypothetical protein
MQSQEYPMFRKQLLECIPSVDEYRSVFDSEFAEIGFLEAFVKAFQSNKTLPMYVNAPMLNQFSLSWKNIVEDFKKKGYKLRMSSFVDGRPDMAKYELLEYEEK